MQWHDYVTTTDQPFRAFRSSALCSSSDGTTTTSTSLEFALDPNSEEAMNILLRLGVTSTSQQTKLRELASLVVEWNQSINLVSRVDCTKEVVFGRHILPSIALKDLFPNDTAAASSNIADVGTGGGFPGLPLAILFPQHDFVMIDSTHKKLKVVQAMADELGLENVRTHHGRVEEMLPETKFDYVLGRSVAPLPKFCFWVQDLLEETSGRLLYIIGGEVPANVRIKCERDVPLGDLLQDGGGGGYSDKRALVLTASSVTQIAKESGEKKVVVKNSSNKTTTTTTRNKKKQKQAKGNWEKTDNSVPKERGYDNFKRYSSF